MATGSQPDEREWVTIFVRFKEMPIPALGGRVGRVPDIDWQKYECSVATGLDPDYPLRRVRVLKSDFEAGAFPTAVEPTHRDRALLLLSTLPPEKRSSWFFDGPKARIVFNAIATEIREAGGTQADARKAIAEVVVAATRRGLRQPDAMAIAAEHGIGKDSEHKGELP